MTEAIETARPTQAAADRCSPIVDLRQYTLFPGTREEFIELFDREFVETQEAAGIRIIGQFRDMSDPNRFVWLRGFPDMPSRETALTSFYVHGEAWRQHAAAARSYMIDTSDALLLHPVRASAAFTLERPARRPALDSPRPSGMVVATIYHLPQPADLDCIEFFDRLVIPVLVEAGGNVLGLFATEHSSNNFPRLPLREGENVFITFFGFEDLEAYHCHMTGVGQNSNWRSDIYPALLNRLQTPPQILRLAPTSRSQLHA